MTGSRCVGGCAISIRARVPGAEEASRRRSSYSLGIVDGPSCWNWLDRSSSGQVCRRLPCFVSVLRVPASQFRRQSEKRAPFHAGLHLSSVRFALSRAIVDLLVVHLISGIPGRAHLSTRRLLCSERGQFCLKSVSQQRILLENRLVALKEPTSGEEAKY